MNNFSVHLSQENNYNILSAYKNNKIYLANCFVSTPDITLNNIKMHFNLLNSEKIILKNTNKSLELFYIHSISGINNNNYFTNPEKGKLSIVYNSKDFIPILSASQIIETIVFLIIVIFSILFIVFYSKKEIPIGLGILIFSLLLTGKIVYNVVNLFKNNQLQSKEQTIVI